MNTWKAEIEITVSDTWVADGFDLNNETLGALLKQMLEERLGYSYEHETKAKAFITEVPKRVKGLQSGQLEITS
jgi:hypothetical protein